MQGRIVSSFTFSLKHAHFLTQVLMRDGLSFSEACNILGYPDTPLNILSNQEKVSAQVMYSACNNLNGFYGDNLMCFKTGFSIQPTNLSIWAQLATQSSTLGDAWDTFIENHHLLGNFPAPEVITQDNSVVFASSISETQRYKADLMLEFRLAIITRMSRILTNDMFPDVVEEIFFQHRASANEMLYQKVANCKVTFSAPYTGVKIRKEYLDMPLLSPDPEIRRSILERLEIIAFTSELRSTSLEVSEIISRTLPDRVCQDEVAKSMGISVSSLKRKLAKEGKSYQYLMDHIRNDLAKRMLKQSSKSINKISKELGFTSISSFSQTFRRLNGVPPSEYRN